VTLLEHAIDALAKGFSIFPCAVRDKLPATNIVAHGCLDATRDEAQVRDWWSHGAQWNVGITNGTILDCDNGLNSLEDLEAFERLHNLPATLCIRTGGRPGFRVQLHYTGIAPNKNYDTGHVSGEVRGWHEYGLGVGSVHPISGERYQLVRDLPRATCPVDLMKPFWKELSSGRGNGKEYDAISIWDAREIYVRLLTRARQARKGSRNHNANNVARFAARAWKAGVFEEFALFNGEIVHAAVSVKELKRQIFRAVNPLYAPGERNVAGMLAYSWNSGIKAGRLALDLYPEDYIRLQTLSDDVLFQSAWDGDISHFGDAVAARAYMQRDLIEAGIQDVQRVLDASRIVDAVAADILFDLQVAHIVTEGTK
jgi:Bifunctional DNA primase/polymerase, N-terminal